MASCVRNTRIKNYQNPIIAFIVTVENVGGPSFFETQCIKSDSSSYEFYPFTSVLVCW